MHCSPFFPLRWCADVARDRYVLDFSITLGKLAKCMGSRFVAGEVPYTGRVWAYAPPTIS